VDRDLFFPLNPVPLLGGPDFRAEVAKVAELGWRAQAGPRVSYSVTAFHMDYDDVRTVRPVPGGSIVANDATGKVSGVEGWGTWHASPRARFSAGLVVQDVDVEVRPGATNLAPGSEGNDPSYWWKLRASLDLTAQHELDVLVRRYGARPSPQVPAYTSLDARLGWRAAKDVELSLALQNLLDRRHPEWGPAANRAEIERAAFVQVRVGL
jgi:iron complex outermembrane receptor protein